MREQSMAQTIKKRVQQAAQAIGTRDPVSYVGPLLDRSFPLPVGDYKYGQNALTPGAVPFEPSFSEQEPDALRFTLEPLGPGSMPLARRDEATREMRRLVGSSFGRDALHWFDQHSEDWRGLFSSPRLHYGAWFGSSYDRDGLHSSKVYYEMRPDQILVLPGELAALARLALVALPDLIPLFTTITCQRNFGKQRITFLCRNPLRLNDLNPLLNQVRLAHQLPSLMQVIGLSLGGRFELPAQSVLLGLAGSVADPEIKLEVMLGMVPDLHPDFIRLLELGLAERPQQLRSLRRWLAAFTPASFEEPGHFSVLSVRIARQTPARVSLYLRPVEFEVNQYLLNQDLTTPNNGRLDPVPAMQPVRV